MRGLGHPLCLTWWDGDRGHYVGHRGHGAEAPGYLVHHLENISRGCPEAVAAIASKNHLSWRGPGTLWRILNFPLPISIGDQFRPISWVGWLPALLVLFLLQNKPQWWFILRQSLWDFFRAAFPSASYCLCSATMTDEAVKDVQSMEIAIYFTSDPTLSPSYKRCVPSKISPFHVCLRVTWDCEGEPDHLVHATREVQHLPPGWRSSDNVITGVLHWAFRCGSMSRWETATTSLSGRSSFPCSLMNRLPALSGSFNTSLCWIQQVCHSYLKLTLICVI